MRFMRNSIQKQKESQKRIWYFNEIACFKKLKSHCSMYIITEDG